MMRNDPDEKAPGVEATPRAGDALQKQERPAADPIQNLDLSRFVEALGPTQFISLVPEGTGEGPMWVEHFDAGDPRAAEFAARSDREGRAAYYTLNTVSAAHRKKPTKADILAVRGAHADLDAPKDGSPFDKAAAVERLMALPLPPSMIVDSGGGLQPVWLLDQPSDRLGEMEGVNRALAKLLGADHCHNIDRLLRLPGSINTPTAKKAAAGRVPVPTSLIHFSDRRFTVEDMVTAYPPLPPEDSERPPIEAEGYRLETADTLGLSPFSDIRNQIDDPLGEDRSSDAYWLAYMMKREGFTDAQVIGVLLNPENAVAVHCVENDKPMRAASRALSAAKRNVAKERAGSAEDRGPGSNPAGRGEATPGPPEPKDAQPLALIDAGSLAGKTVEPMAFAIHKLAPENLVTLFTARGGGGKSHISLSLAACVAIGSAAYGLKTRQAPSIYITAEDDDAENHRRLIGVANALNVGLDAFAGRLFLLSLVDRRDKGLVRIDLHSNKMAVLPLFHELRASIMQVGARFVVLDNVAHLFEGNENIRAHVAAFLGLLNALALETGCAIILISHPNKAGDSFSGSTAFQNQVRSHMHLEVDANDPDARELTLMKANYARLEEPLRLRWHNGAFRLEMSIPAHESEVTNRERLEDQRFLACLSARNADKRPVSMHVQARESYAPRAFAKMPLAKDMTVEQFEGAMERLLAGRVIAQIALDYDKPNSPGHKAEGLAQIGAVEVSDEPF